MKKEEKKVYILCPRCDLNYIHKKEKLCTVCKAEIGLIDPSILIPDEEEAGVEKLCPVCHVNYIGEDEDICFICLKEREERNVKDEWDFETDEDIPESEVLDEDLDEIVLSDEEAVFEEEEELPEFPEPNDFDFDIDEDDFDEDEDEDEDFDDEDDEEFKL